MGADSLGRGQGLLEHAADFCTETEVNPGGNFSEDPLHFGQQDDQEVHRQTARRLSLTLVHGRQSKRPGNMKNVMSQQAARGGFAGSDGAEEVSDKGLAYLSRPGPTSRMIAEHGEGVRGKSPFPEVGCL